MKICWDNLENIRLTKNGNFRDIVKKRVYYYKKCKHCSDTFLGGKDSIYCSYSCSSKDQWEDPTNSFNSSQTKSKISQSVKKLWKDKQYRENCSSKIKEVWANPDSNYNQESYRKKLSESSKGDKNFYWKGGYWSRNLPSYNTHAHQLDWCEEIRRNKKDPNVLEVRCTHCGKWFIPSFNNVRNRILSIYGYNSGENRFYCSEKCKRICPIYAKNPQALMKEDAIRAGRLQWLELNREVQPELRQMVLKRDGYECVKCGSSDKPLHCHHILPVAEEPLLSADVDNCITLCEECHREVHKLPGCGYGEIRMEVC